jgi:type I restriction enzyme S subunit
MKHYDKYKDSGIDWVGQIPEHWESIRLKYIGFLYGGLAGKSINDFNQESNLNNKLFIPFTNICNNKVIDPNQMQKVIIEEGEQQNQVQKGDLFFMMSSENFDDVGKSSILLDDLQETYLNSFCKGFRFTNELYYPPFINYLLLSKPYRSLVLTEANGYTRINLKIEKIKDIQLKVPPTLGEQQTIADYLDSKTAEIDELIKSKEELLLRFEEEKNAIINQAVTKGINPNAKMKKSGIDWLGEIPEHWDLMKLRYLVKIISGFSPEQCQPTNDGEIEYIKVDDISKNTYKVAKPTTYTTKENIASEGLTILFPKRGAAIALNKVGIVDRPICFDTNLMGLQIQSEKIDIYYLANTIKNFSLISIADTSTIPQINNKHISPFQIPLPPLNEQIEILNQIQKDISRVEERKAITIKMIELCRDYKTALITEVVTGKVKVFK